MTADVDWQGWEFGWVGAATPPRLTAEDLGEEFFFAGRYATAWTSRDAKEEALSLVRPKEQVLREVLLGDRRWEYKLDTSRKTRRKDGTYSSRGEFMDKKRDAAYVDYIARLSSIGVLRYPYVDDRSECSIFGYRVPLDERLTLAALARLGVPWTVNLPSTTTQIGPIALDEPVDNLHRRVFLLIDCGPVVCVSTSMDGALSRRACCSIDDAIRFVVASGKRADQRAEEEPF